MATLSVRTIVANCLGKAGTLSLLRDVFGVYGESTEVRSLLDQLDLIQNHAFVRLALVTIQGAVPNLQRDLDNTTLVYLNECGCWAYCVGSITVDRAHLLILDQDDCWGNGHDVSDEEDELFDLGRGMGADIVGYYITSDAAGYLGCAAHPPGRRGFWVGDAASPWTFPHELGHVVGDNSHINDTDNLMYGGGTFNITNAPPDLSNSQCNRINSDPDMESCS